ncbi:ABC transporter ATP-binding protein [Dyella jejuensis]|uniref:ABC transporter ATP-binding protein n=1 Tax=Dyella jejuensis TaxID=1432009 RepID=A0ABW8JEN4_9GAMM
MSASNLIVAADISVSYGEHEVLKNVSLCCGSGSWVGVLGANGCGKSTLLRAITGQVPFKEGDISINGVSLSLDPVRAKSQFGYALDSSELPKELTGLQFLELMASIRNALPNDLSDRLIKAFHVEPWLNETIGRYSYGTRKKIGILGALIGNPSVLVLDESINGLDPMSAWHLKQVMDELVREGSKTVIMATHAIDVVYEFCSDALLLHGGAIVRSWHLPDIKNAGITQRQFEAEVMGIMSEASV